MQNREKPTTTTGRKQDNQYDFINLKDSDIKMIKIKYYIGINEKKGYADDTMIVYIAIPRIVDNFYFRINGNIYSAMYQIVDASTYNNNNSKNAKKLSVTFKTIFMPSRVYKYINTLRDVNDNELNCTYFVGNMFKKSLLLMKYIFAKMGYYNTLNFLKVPGVIISEDYKDINQDEMYTFPIRANLFVSIPKYIYNISILGSLEFIYDIGTKRDLRLDPEDKDDIYRILRWMMYEFNALRKKDNLDISTKKVRYAEYIAALYASRLAVGIYRLSDKGDKADLDTVRKAIRIPPMYLMNAITKCQLVNYKDCVNDLDALTALKYTYKGVSGIGEKSNAISSAYRAIHPSHLGRVDIDSSSNSDPGVSGTLCPFNTLHDLHFIDFKEPSTWDIEINKMINQYKSMNNKIEICRLVKDTNLSEKQSYNSNIPSECKAVAKNLLKMPTIVSNNVDYINGYDLFGDGLIYILNE